MNHILHTAGTRGSADFGWLKANYSFSFANYQNPERVHFGALRVLNDDQIAPGRGFGTHGHDNMEIITIPLEGDLEHKDSMGHTSVIRHGNVQSMTAGTGIMHSEYNKNSDKLLKLLQIWIFPRERNVSPRYDQISLDLQTIKDDMVQIASPNKSESGVTLNQDAWMHLGKFSGGTTYSYPVRKSGNGLYAFLIDGQVEIEQNIINRRDAIGLWDLTEVEIVMKQDSELLLIEVPMTF